MLFGNAVKHMLVRTVVCGNHFLKIRRSFPHCGDCFALRRTRELGNEGYCGSEVEAHPWFYLHSGFSLVSVVLSGSGSDGSAGTHSGGFACMPMRK